METISISKRRNNHSNKALVQSYLGFRPFFLAAAILSVVSMSIWFLVFSGGTAFAYQSISASQWHAHEMIFGYTFAVIAGFLLTAIGNWTGIPAARGLSLLWILIPWIAARCAWMFGEQFLPVAALTDSVFSIGLCTCIYRSIAISKSWKHFGVLSKVFLLGACNVFFYLASFKILILDPSSTLLAALYLITALILTIGFRVLPSYTQIALDLATPPQLSFIGSIITLILFVALFLNKVFTGPQAASSIIALLLFVVVTYRLTRLFYPGIFTRPLLWGLYLALVSINLGFANEFVSLWYTPLPNLPTHFFAIGGIGLSTVTMMSRVTLGHTGRSVLTPPPATSLPVLLILVALVSRVIVPILSPAFYATAMAIAQLSWILASFCFLLLYGKFLIYPRQDRKED